MPPSPTVSTAPNTMPSRGGNGLIFGSFTAKIPQISAPSARISPTNPRPPTLYPPSPDARNDWITAVQNTANAAIAVQKDKIPVGECFKSLIRVFRVRRKYFLLLLAIRCLLIYLHDMFTPIVKSNSDLSLFFYRCRLKQYFYFSPLIKVGIPTQVELNFTFSIFWHRHPGPVCAATAHRPDTPTFHRLYSGKYRPHQNSRFWLQAECIPHSDSVQNSPSL